MKQITPCLRVGKTRFRAGLPALPDFIRFSIILEYPLFSNNDINYVRKAASSFYLHSSRRALSASRSIDFPHYFDAYDRPHRLDGYHRSRTGPVAGTLHHEENQRGNETRKATGSGIGRGGNDFNRRHRFDDSGNFDRPVRISPCSFPASANPLPGNSRKTSCNRSPPANLPPTVRPAPERGTTTS